MNSRCVRRDGRRRPVASVKHYYAGPGNEFWLLLHGAGLTDESFGPERDAEILRYGIGLTDIAKRRSASRDSLLVRGDFGIPGFVAKIERYAPDIPPCGGR